MRWRRTLPASLASTSWPFSSLTRKLPPLAMRTTSPSRWTSSSLLTTDLRGGDVAPKPNGGLPWLRGSAAAPGDQRRDRPVHPHLLLAFTVQRRRPGPGLRGGPPVLAVEPAPRGGESRAGSRGVCLCRRAPARVHPAGPPDRAGAVAAPVRLGRARGREVGRGPHPRPAAPLALGRRRHARGVRRVG